MEDNDMTEEFGFGVDAAYEKGDNKVFAKIFRIKTPNPAKGEDKVEFVCRLLPPMKSLANNPHGWYRFHKIHWGYAGINSKGNKVQRPFECVEEKDFKTKMIKRHCAECDLVRERKDQLVVRKSTLESRGVSPEAIQEELGPLNQWVKSHNRDDKYYINIMTLNGEFGHLLVNGKLFSKLKMELEQLSVKRSINALNLETGIWFKFSAIGYGLVAQFDVEPYKEVTMHPELGEVEIIKRAPMTKEQAKSAVSICMDLTQVTRIVSSSQIEMLTNSSGDPEEVDRILGLGQRIEETPVVDSDSKVVSQPVVVHAQEMQHSVTVGMVSSTNPETSKAVTADISSMSDTDFFNMMKGVKK